MTVLRIIAFLAGLVLAAQTMGSAVRTVVVPRAESLLLPRVVFGVLRWMFGLSLSRISVWERRDRVLAYLAPAALIALAMTWIGLTVVAFAPMYWAVGVDSWREAFRVSGSSVTTLGLASTGTDLPGTMLEVVEAVIGLILVALLISFLPTMYSMFSSRERMVAFMAVRASTPPSGVDLLERLHLIGDDDDLHDIWIRFEAWFDEIAESHTSFMAVPFFRSPNPQRSWLRTAAAVLDAAALRASAIDEPTDPQTNLCLRSGYTALNEIAHAFGLEVRDDPAPDDPISITRGEFDDALDRLAAADLDIVADRDQAWRDYAGWRVNYDDSVILLGGFLSAPFAPWATDRSLRLQRPTGRTFLSRRPLRFRSRVNGPV